MYGQGAPTRVHREAYTPGYTGRHIPPRIHREAERLSAQRLLVFPKEAERLCAEAPGPP